MVILSSLACVSTAVVVEGPGLAMTAVEPKSSRKDKTKGEEKGKKEQAVRFQSYLEDGSTGADTPASLT